MAHEKSRDLDPTVIPAQPGYRIALLDLIEDDAVTEKTPLSQVDVFYSPVIAWLIQPRVKDGSTWQEVNDATVYPVTPDGLIEQDNAFLVSPDNAWSQPYVRSFDSEDAAKEYFIESKSKAQL